MITLFIFRLLLLCISLHAANGAEWNCSSTTNTGTFTRSTDCTTISGNNHVTVSNTLEIVGSNTDMNHLITITAASKHRHFYLNNANAKLILRYLKLIGGNLLNVSPCVWNGGNNPDYHHLFHQRIWIHHVYQDHYYNY